MRRVVAVGESSPGSSTGELSAGPQSPDGFVPSPKPEPSPGAKASKKREPTAEEEAALLALLEPEERERCEEGMASRYLRATGHDRQQALRRVRETLAWRETERPEETVCTACQRDPKSHYMQVIGFDLQRRPTIYSCLELAGNRVVDDNRRHMIACFEQAIRVMPPGVQSWSWVLDFHGFGLADADPRLARIFLSLAERHYPERLGQFFVVGAPTLFSTLWRALTPFIDPVTRAKIHFASFEKRGDNAKLRAVLEQGFGPEVTAWLLAEMRENRSKGHAPHKSYSYPDLAALAHAREGDAEALAAVASAAEARRAAAASPGHDFLGTPGLLDRLAGRPHLLPPHLRAAPSCPVSLQSLSLAQSDPPSDGA